MDLWERARRELSPTGEGNWLPPSMPGDRRAGTNWPLYRTEIELAQFRQRSRVVCQTNGYAGGLVRGLVNYTVGSGCKYEVGTKEKLPDSDPEKMAASGASPEEIEERGWLEKQVAQAQDIIDHFLATNNVNGHDSHRATGAIPSTKEQETVRRVIRDGESFWRLFRIKGGRLAIRFVEPEQVMNHPGASWLDGWFAGVKHRVWTEDGADGRPVRLEDVSTIEAYNIRLQAPEQGQSVPGMKGAEGVEEGGVGQNEEVEAKDIIHLTGPDTDSTLKRGMPWFSFDTLDAFERAAKLARAVSISATIKACTAEIWSHETGTQAQVGSMASAAATYQVQNPISGQAENIVRAREGMIRRTPIGIKPVPNPPDHSESYLAAQAADLRGGAAAFNAPEYMAGADASNANFASTKEAGTPFVRAAETWQSYYTGAFCRLAWEALKWAAECGLIEEKALPMLTIQVEAPKVVMREALQIAQEDQIGVTVGWKDRKTCALERNMDWDQVQANNQEYQETQSKLAAEAAKMMPQPPGKPGEGGAAAGGGPPKPPAPRSPAAKPKEETLPESVATQEAVDQQGGEQPLDAARARSVDFITYPPDVKGSNCSNCRFNHNGICTHPEVSEGRNQPVTERNCCAKWDRAGTLRDWQEMPVREAEGDDADPDQLADLIADVLGGLYGEKALELIDQLEDEPATESLVWAQDGSCVGLLEAWAEVDHPRGKGGRFIPKHSAEARAAAGEEVKRALKTPATPEGLKKLVEHLSILTVKQLHELKQAHGLKASAGLKEQLVAKLADRLHRGRREEPAGGAGGGKEQGPKEEPATREPWSSRKRTNFENDLLTRHSMQRDAVQLIRQAHEEVGIDVDRAATLARAAAAVNGKASAGTPEAFEAIGYLTQPDDSGEPPAAQERRAKVEAAAKDIKPFAPLTTPRNDWEEHVRRLSMTGPTRSPLKNSAYWSDKLGGTQKQHVAAALAAGKSVPSEVLADYPDLKAQAAPAPSAPAGGKEPAAQPAPHAPVASTVERLASAAPGGTVSLADLKDALPSMSMADMHATLRDLWKAGAVSFDEIEGRGGTDPREEAAALEVPSSRGHPSPMGHVYVADPEKLRAYLASRGVREAVEGESEGTALLEDFDPGEKRDDSGKWTKGGAGGKKAEKDGNAAGKKSAEVDNKGKAPKGELATPEQHAAAVKIARAKLKSVPEPTDAEVEAAREGMARLGANKYRKNLIGNTKDRAKRRNALLQEFGDGKTCPCVYCGLSISHGTLEQDKIKTTAEGGRYRTPNLVPACGDCNKRRSDMPFAEALKKVVNYGGATP